MTETGDCRHFDIVIAGAGFTGMALARALTLAIGSDLRIALVDQVRPSPVQRPFAARAFAVSRSSQRLLETIGAWENIAPHAQPVARIEISDSGLDDDGRPTLLTYDNHLGDGAAGSMIVPDAALTASLAETLAPLDNIAVLAPETVAAFNATARNVEIRLGSGAVLGAELLIAADGRRSRVRDMAGIKTVSWDYGQTGIVVTVAHERAHEGTAVQHFLPAGPFAILPLPGTSSCITWSEQRDVARRILALDDAAFVGEVEKRSGGRLGRLTLAGPRQSWPLDMVLARQTVAARFALAGDAAHGVHPIAGQGVNLALRDVAALTEVLAETARAGMALGSATALERYQRWRRFDAASAALAFDGLNRLFSSDSTLLRAARGFGLGLVDRLPGLKAMLVSEAAGVTGELPRLLKGERV